MRVINSIPNSMTTDSTDVILASSLMSLSFLRRAVDAVATPRVQGTKENKEVRDWIVGQLEEMKIGPVTVDKVGNVIVNEKATTLIGAHYDSVPDSPGADDNASAVAVMLGVADVISLSVDWGESRPAGPIFPYSGKPMSVGFVAFNGEENNLEGSRFFCKQDRSYLKKVHILEMVGFTAPTQKNPIPIPGVEVPSVGDFLGLVGSHHSAQLLESVIAKANCSSIPVYGLQLPDLPLSVIQQMAPHVFRSDHSPFWDKSIPALMWTDTAEFRNPHYHQPTDTPDTLDYMFMADVVNLLVHTIIED